MSKRSLYFTTLDVVLASFATGVAAGIILFYYGGNIIPASSRIEQSYYRTQQGYVIPRNLEIKLKDLDKNGEVETILRYKDKNYLLKLDGDGKPFVDFYE